MSDDLAVGGPHATSVLTTSLVQQSHQLGTLHRELVGCQRQLASIDRIIGNGILTAADAPQSAIQAEAAMDDAAVAIVRAIEHSDLLSRGLASAASGYEFAENFAARLNQELAAGLAYGIGLFLPLIVTMILPGALIVGAAGFGAGMALSEESRARLFLACRSWFRANSAPLSDPVVVEAIRMTVMSADDFGGGVLALPPGLVRLLGDEGLGITGVDTSAGVVAGVAAGVGLMRETPVSVRAGASTTGLSNAVGVQDRVERIPKAPEQVRIDRYWSQGAPDRFEVYIAGTAEPALSGDNEAWDMTSNLAALSGDSAASYRAVEEAMRQAGISASTPVTLTGYSQGGLVAAQLAASGDYAVEGLVTLGAPAGQVAVPHDIPYLAIEHTNDLVPALGGTFASSEPVTVRRQLFDGPPPPSEFALPAHRLSNYLDTAGLIDASDNAQLREVLDRLSHRTAHTVSLTVFQAVRAPG